MTPDEQNRITQRDLETASELARIDERLKGVHDTMGNMAVTMHQTKTEVASIARNGCARFSEHQELLKRLANTNGNGHNAKLEIGPLKISGLTATVVTRITLVGGIGYVIAKMHGWL